MKGLSWFLAQRYLSSRKGGRLLSFITWIALGGVVVGVTALVVVIGVMTGMQEDLQAKILGSTPHVLVLEEGASLRLNDWHAVLDTVRHTEGVVAAAPFVLGNVFITRSGYSQSALMYGVSTDTAGSAPTDMERDILQGALDLKPPPSGLPPLLMGIDLANNMQVFPGDTLWVSSFENLKLDLFAGVIPASQEFEVTGTFETGMYDYDTRNVYTSLQAAQDFLGLDSADAVSGIGARTVTPDVATAVADELQARLGFPYRVQSWISTNRALFSALKLEKLTMGVILFLIVVVAAFNIISTLVMVVSDRTREIGILKSMGMTDRGILAVFMLQGAWIGIVGTVLGTVLGLGLCWVLDTFEVIKIPAEVYFVDRLPVSLHVGDVLMIVAASIFVAFAATVYPSLQASRLQPVEAIRHD